MGDLSPSFDLDSDTNAAVANRMCYFKHFFSSKIHSIAHQRQKLQNLQISIAFVLIKRFHCFNSTAYIGLGLTLDKNVSMFCQ